MPFPITKGFGSQGDGTSSALISTQGYGDPGASNACTTFSLLLVEVYEDRLELVFSVPVQAIGPAAVGAGWPITTLVGGAPVPTVTNVVVAGPRIKLFTTEARDGVLYTLHFPVVGIKDLSDNPYSGPFTYDFLGNGIEPFVSLAGAEDGFHVKVIFSEPVVVSEALVPGNYVITGGGGLTVFEVTQETAQSFILRTSMQTVGQTYTVTVSNIHDLLGNLI
jgi:hypothetical protein